MPRKIFALTPTLSQREREPAALSLWERVGVRAKNDLNPDEPSFLFRLVECYILTDTISIFFSDASGFRGVHQ